MGKYEIGRVGKRGWSRLLVICGVVAGLAGPAGAELYGVFTDQLDGMEMLGRIDTTTWTIEALSAAKMDVGAYQTGVSDVDEAVGLFYFVANQGKAWERSIWTVSGYNGSYLASTLSATDLVTTDCRLMAVDGATGDVFLILGDATDMTKEALALVDPVTGTVTRIGSGFDLGGYLVGVTAFNIWDQEMYVVGNGGGVNHRIFSIDAATGVVNANPEITVDGDVIQNVVTLAYDEVLMRLTALLYERGGRSLVEIDPATGVATRISTAPIPENGLPGSTSAFDDTVGMLYYVAAVDGSGANGVFAVDRDGELAGSSVLADGTDYLLDTTPRLMGAMPEPVPEPSLVALQGVALLMLGVWRGRRGVARDAA